MTIFKSLMTRFLLGASLMILFLALLSIGQKYASEIQKMFTNWQAQADKILLDIASLQQQAQHYKLNAPRDFDSYHRDVAVFYQQFRQQLEALHRSFEKANDSAHLISSHPAFNYLAQEGSPLLKAIQQQATWHAYWGDFTEQLQQQLGDPNEPRLEWAAEYIIDNQQTLSGQAAALSHHVLMANSGFSDTANRLNMSLIVVIVVYLTLAIILFAIRVLRPVLATTRACERVATGHYGEKVALSGVGETRRLQHAFNELSARSKLMMDMLNDVHRPGGVPEKLQSIYDSGKEALGSNWIGLIALDTNSIHLHSSVPDALDVNFRHRNVSPHKAFAKDLQHAFNDGWLTIRSLRQLSLNRHDERFLRELHKNTLSTEIVGYPFSCPKHNRFILLFSSNQKTGFSQQQTQLIKALSKLMADAIIAGLDQQTHKETGLILQ